MKLLKLISLEGVTDAEAATYQKREAVRAIVKDADGNVAVFHATKNGYYKLPGGGIDAGESREQALHRECLEEIGCAIEITGEVGMIIEYRKKYGLHQTSYCYTADLIGEKGIPQMMPDEIEEGFRPEWMPIDQAIIAVRDGDKGRTYESQYMIARDTLFLEEGKKLLS
jgi:8-oxo-dGTP diphosphatase